ncbi:MAG TPA: NEW3 domain-containing protein [Acidimicrobiia bacterium]|nr:NEW3 domain-containing protein [Acidimicrobiia bacterium]
MRKLVLVAPARVVLAGLLLVAVSSPAAAQTTSFSLSTPYPGLTVEPGDTAGFDLALSADSTAAVNLAVDGVPEDWIATFRGAGFVINQVTVGPELAPELRLDVIVPSGTADGDYPMTITASGGGATASLPVTVTVQGGAGGSVTLTPEFPGLRGPASSTFTFNVDVRNDTASEVQLELAAEGPIGWTVDARPQAASQASSITVESGSTGRVTVTATPPSTVEAGLYDLRVTARGGGVDSEAALQVEITGSFSMELTTPDQRLNADVTAGSPTQFPLVILNTGSGDLANVALTATPPAGWEVTFDTESITTVPAGDFAQVTATITPSTEAIAGDYSITFRANTDQADASMDVRSTVSPSAFGGLVGIGLILLTLAALAWVFRRFGRR